MIDTPETLKPELRIEKIHIRGLRGLTSLNLPEEGLGWDGTFPPVAVFGGANGGGKTTLLKCLAGACRQLVATRPGQAVETLAQECMVDFVVGDGHSPSARIRFLRGSRAFVEDNMSADCFGYVTDQRRTVLRRSPTVQALVAELAITKNLPKNLPRLVFMPSDQRDLVVPRATPKANRPLRDDAGFVVWWNLREAVNGQNDTYDMLFSARWADLNALASGETNQPKNFERFVRAFSDLTLHKKVLDWTPSGELVVRLADQGTHGVDELSSGERQALLLLAELRRHWRPGSLILIDELELHLHDAWQGQLYEILIAMQKELGGQVIITTQSQSLFEMATPGTRCLLGRGGMR